MNVQHISEIDNLFHFTEEKYRSVFSEQERDIDLEWLKKQWGRTPNSPLVDLTTLLGRLYKSQKLKAEINDNILNAHSGYFTFTSNVIGKRLNFAKEHFSEALCLYFNDNVKANELIADLDDEQALSALVECTEEGNDTDLKKSNYLLAVQLSYVKNCELFEDLQSMYNAKYIRVFVPSIIELQNSADTIEHIKLRYTNNQKAILAIVHKYLLDEGLIDVSIQELIAHFNPHATVLPKIKWKGSLILLCVIFVGAVLNDESFTTIEPLKVYNNRNKLIREHFCPTSNISEYDEASLRTTIAKLAYRRNTVGIHRLIEPLKQIQGLQK